MRDLIERLEKATGPDRELDRLIAVHPGTPSCGVVKGADTSLVRTAEEDWCPPVVVVPAYTASLDAALTLVPEGADICIYFMDRSKRASGDKIQPWCVEVEYSNRVYTARSETAAHAASVAALKARAAVERDLTKMDAGI